MNKKYWMYGAGMAVLVPAMVSAQTAQDAGALLGGSWVPAPLPRRKRLRRSPQLPRTRPLLA